MKKYMVEYTASVTGSMAGRDDGQPYRTKTVGTDRYAMFKLYEEKLDEKGKRYGWEEPVIYEMDVYELAGGEVLLELDNYEKTKNFGEGI
jgi:hypothetical protein